MRVNLLRAHGSPHPYLYRKGCRCRLCKAGYADFIRAYRHEHPEILRKQHRDWKSKNPQKRKAHRRISQKLARGDSTITRQPCEVCGAFPAEAHHDDYSQPLLIRWLCTLHHRELHRLEV